MLVAGMAADFLWSATDYVVPWYVNPSLQALVQTANNGLAVVSLDMDKSGETLLMTAKAAEGFDNVQAFSMSDISMGSGNLTEAHRESQTLAVDGAPIAAVAGEKNLLFAFASDFSTAKAMSATAARWLHGMAPDNIPISAEDAPDSVDFNIAGTSLYANSTLGGRGNLLVKWDFSNGAFTKAADIDTGLSAVGAVSVYAINGVEYAVVASGDASGQIRLVDTQSRAVTTVVNDPAHLSSGVRAVKMSHLDFFRPRFYALLKTGDVAVYTYRPESGACDYSKTIGNAELLALADSPWTADAASATALEVSPDGKCAVIGFAPKSNSGAAVAKASRIAVLKHEAPRWTYYAVGQAGNPVDTACITDGSYVLRCSWSGNKLYLGTGASTPGSAWGNNHMAEYLDLSRGVCEYRNGDNSETFPISRQWQNAFGTNGVGRAPRVLIHSTSFDNYYQFVKGWNVAGAYEEVVFDTPNVKWGESWTSVPVNTRYFIANLPNLIQIKDYSFYGNSNTEWKKEYFCSDSRFEDLVFPNLEQIGVESLAYRDSYGTLTLPKIKTIGTAAFAQCRNMEEAILSPDSCTLETLGEQAFDTSWESNAEMSGSLRRVVIGGKTGFRICGDKVFRGQPIEEVVFTGAVPTFDDDVDIVWPDTAEKTLVFAVPRDRAEWANVLSGRTRPLTESERKAFWQAHPRACIPHAIVESVVFRSRYDQYIAWNDAQGGCALSIEKNAFFDDEVEVSSDQSPSADGRYMPGTRVTLTAKPGKTGTFAKWYGDVAADAATNPSVTLTLTGDTWIYARFVHPWTIADDEKTATDGNFTINIASVDVNNRGLTIALSEKHGLFADTDVGQGVLDMGGPFFKKGDDTPWTCYKWGSATGLFVGKPRGKGAASAILFPFTCANMPYCQMLNNSSDRSRLPKLLVIDAPDMTGLFEAWANGGQINMSRVILQCPRMTGFKDGFFPGEGLTDTKMDWWDLKSVVSFANQSFAIFNPERGIEAKGTLSLPSIRNVVTSGSRGPFWKMGCMEGVVLGGLDEKATVTNICPEAFLGTVSLRSVRLHNSPDIAIGPNPFKSGRIPDEIRFSGAAPQDILAVENLLSDVTAAEVKPMKIYASAYMRGWMDAPYIDYAVTAEERAEAPGERVIGVIRCGAQAPLGKALVVHARSPYDPKGTVVTFR